MNRKEETLKIINLIENGVMQENGTTREFDVIDYYNTTTMTPEAFLSNTSMLENSYYSTIAKRYVKKHLSGEKLMPCQINTILKEKLEINCKEDANGHLMVGSGRLIERAEKASIMEYLVSRNIPLTHRTYASAFGRLRNNIPFEQEETKVKKLEK